MNKKRQVGIFLRKLRASSKMTREDLSGSSTLSTRYIGEVERGEKLPSLPSFVKFEIGLNKTEGDMIKEIIKVIYPAVREMVKENRRNSKKRKR